MARTVVYLRFPRNRMGFKDPPIVEWNATKEKELWAMLKNTSTDLEWHELANHFGVPLVYILQQAAWLYEKELGVLRKRMSRISTSLTQDRLVPVSHGEEPSHINENYLGPDTTQESNRDIPLTSSRLDSYDDSQKSASFTSLGEGSGFATRRLLSTSRVLASDDESDFSDESELGVLLTTAHDMEVSSSMSGSTVSQSALEAALIEQSNQSEASDTY